MWNTQSCCSDVAPDLAYLNFRQHSSWFSSPQSLRSQVSDAFLRLPSFFSQFSSIWVFHKKSENVSGDCDRLNGWNSTLQAAWYIRHGRWACVFYISFNKWFCELNLRYGCWYSVSQFLRKVVRAYSIFDPHEGYRSVTPLDAAWVNRMIFHNHSAHWYYITRIEGGDYIKQAIITWPGQQNPRRGLGL